MSHKNRTHRPVYDKPTEQGQGAHLKADTKECCRDAAEHLRAIKELLCTIKNDEKGENAKAAIKDAKKWKLDVATFGVIATYTGLTFGLFGLGFCQLRDVNIQTVAQTRAWLEPEDFKFSTFESGDKIVVRGTTENVGHEPAMYPGFQTPEFGVIPIPPEACCDPRTIRIPEGDICANLAPRNSGVIFPGQKLDYERYIRPDSPIYPTPEQFSAVKDGLAVFYWKDCVAYSTLSSSHTSSFCHYLMRDPVSGTLRRTQCIHGNDAS